MSLCLHRLSEPWIRIFQLPSFSRPSSRFCSSNTTGLCMIWLLVLLLSSAPGPDDAISRGESHNFEQALRDVFEKCLQNSVLYFQKKQEHYDGGREIDMHQCERFQTTTAWVWFVSDTYCISACVSTCCFQICSCAKFMSLLKTGKMMVFATFSLKQDLPLLKYSSRLGVNVLYHSVFKWLIMRLWDNTFSVYLFVLKVCLKSCMLRFFILSSWPLSL